ncbi:hypothetical protein NMG60_11004727 [Bertholletia excelsa]
MAFGSHDSLFCLITLILAVSLPNSEAHINNENVVKSSTFLSPKFVLGPGSVINHIYYNIDFPKGHIAIKSFDAEVVDEAGNPIPLHETYLHHWVVFRYYIRKGVEVPKYHGNTGFHQSDIIFVQNSGPCGTNLGQYFGLGSETRKTSTHVPDPYGIEVGNPAEVPSGYEEKWLMNVHAIDTRGVEDRLGCIECKCDLYNVTVDEYGRPLRPDYKGGLYCCYDQTQCRVKNGFESFRRGLYMRYTVTWVDWGTSIIEYEVESCSMTGVTSDGCADSRRVSLVMPTGGNVVYAVAHQHTGGIGATLYGEDGRVICTSRPTYGNGKEPGNETGYIVGMSTCYPYPGSVKISDGETLVLESNYSSGQSHVGVMGLFYLLVADASPNPNSFSRSTVEKQEHIAPFISLWGIALFGVAIAVAVVVAYWKRSEREDGYQSIIM